MLKTYLVVLTLMSTQAFAQIEYVDALLQNRNPRIMKRLGLDKKVKKEVKVVAAEKKEMIPVVDEQTKKLAELKTKEEEISAAALKQLTEYMDKKGKDHDVFTDPDYFKLLSEVKKKEKADIAKLYEGIWKPEELTKHNVLYDRDICRGDRNVFLLGKVKPVSAVPALMDKHDPEFDKQEANRIKEQVDIEIRREKIRNESYTNKSKNWKYDPMVEDGFVEDPSITVPDAKAACEVMLENDKKLFTDEPVVEKKVANEPPKIDQYLKNLDVESCTWVAEMPRRKFFGPGCGPSSKKYICAGYVSCKQKNSELRTIRASTCSDENCGDGDAVACTKEGGYGSVKPTKEETVKPVTPREDNKGSAE
jgi:hypothetical protein